MKFIDKDEVPGPGKYKPDVLNIKNKSPSYFLGEKSKQNSINLLVGTGIKVGPGTYSIEEIKKSNKFKDVPKWTIGRSKRKELNLKLWTENETYCVESSLGQQCSSRKKTEPMISLGKLSRETKSNLGVYPM